MKGRRHPSTLCFFLFFLTRFNEFMLNELGIKWNIMKLQIPSSRSCSYWRGTQSSPKGRISVDRPPQFSWCHLKKSSCCHKSWHNFCSESSRILLPPPVARLLSGCQCWSSSSPGFAWIRWTHLHPHFPAHQITAKISPNLQKWVLQDSLALLPGLHCTFLHNIIFMS